MGLTDGGKPKQSDITPLNIMSARTNPEGQDAQDTASSANDTIDVKSGTDQLYDLPGIQRLLRPRPKIQVSTTPGAGHNIPAPAPRQANSSNDRKAVYRDWLKGKTKEDLIELLVGLEGREAANEATRKIMKTQVEEATGESPSSPKIPDDLPYMRLPVLRRTSANEPTPTWRIVLLPLAQDSKPLGLQIDGEITVGRTGGDVKPDLDLTPFGAKNGGVSRFHACLRPLINNLMLIDYDSSNGTYWNQQRLPTQTEHPIKDGDIITFGRVSFLVKIIKSPNMHEIKTLL